MQHWSAPVTFTVGLGVTFTVSSTDDAARYLLTRWPNGGGEAHRVARQACLDALEGKASWESARLGFIAACEEAGMSVMPDDFHKRPEPREKKKRRR